MTQPATVLRYARYMGRDSQSVYTYENFCGACRRGLEHPYTFPRHPEDLEAECDSPHGLGPLDLDRNRQLSYFSFCPWCGVRFEDEWWRNQPLQNERPVDHYDHPGSHKGDTHVFAGAVEGHHLGSSDPSHICWCQPEVTPSLLGCEIRHTVLPPPEPSEFVWEDIQ